MIQQRKKNKPLALILGGSSGMGLASAHKLASNGYDLCLLYRERRNQNSRLEAEQQKMQDAGAEVLAFNLDAGSQQTIEKVLNELQSKQKRIKLFLHSIARGNLKPLAHPEFSGSTEDLIADQDLLTTSRFMAFSYYSWAREILLCQLFSEGAVCLALSSEGSRRSWPNYAAVSAAKAALESLSRSMAAEFAPYGVRSNILMPGVTDTPALRMIPEYEQLIEESKKRNPNKRLTNPEDVANVVYLMGLPEAAWINGAIIPVDGGENIV